MRRSTFESITVSLGRPMNQSISGTHENFDCGVTWLKRQASYVPNLMHKLLQYTLGSILQFYPLFYKFYFLLFYTHYHTLRPIPPPPHPNKRVIKVTPTIKLNLYTLLV